MSARRPPSLVPTIALFVLISCGSGWAQESPLVLTPERTKAAFAWGLTAPEKDLEQYELHSDVSWLVNFDTPWLRVAQFARATKIQRHDASEDDIPAAVAAPEVHIYAHAQRSGDSEKSGMRLPDVEYLSIFRPREDRPDEIILPLSIQTFIRRVPQRDVFTSRTLIARSARGTFPASAFRAGNRLRIVFGGGASDTVLIPETLLASIR